MSCGDRTGTPASARNLFGFTSASLECTGTQSSSTVAGSRPRPWLYSPDKELPLTVVGHPIPRPNTFLSKDRFAALYQGTWQLAPDLSELKVVIIGDGVAQLYVPITFTIGASGQAPQSTQFLMNRILRKTPTGWKVSSILPIPVPAP